MHTSDLFPRFGIHTLAPSVQRWLAEGSPDRGPLRWAAPESVLGSALPCRALAPDAPEGPLPAAKLCEVDGVEVFVVLDTGAVIALHHDATLYEVASEAAKQVATPAAFARFLADRGSALDLDELRSLAAAVAEWASLTTGKSEGARIRAIAAGLGIPLRELHARRTRNPAALELLHLDRHVLEAMASVEGRLARLPMYEARVNLRNGWLEAWPDALDGHPVEDLDLSGNPDLPWQELVPRLRALPTLRLLRVARSGVDADALAAALPGVAVRGDRRAEVAPTEGGKALELRGVAGSRLPAIVDALTTLEVIDLSENTELDWDDACTRLAALPNLREVCFGGCGLPSLPPLHRVSTLERLSFASGWRGKRNQKNLADVFALLERLPNLRVLDLDDVEFGYNQADLALPELPALEELALKVAGRQRLGDIAAWIGRLPRLRRLTLAGPFAGELPLAALHGRALEALDARFCSDQLPALLDSLPHLTSLGLDLLVDREEFPASVRGMRGLRRLDLRCSYYSHTFALPSWLAELPIEDLSFEAKTVDLNALLATLASLRHLRRLRVHLSGYSSDLAFPLVLDAPALEDLVLHGGNAPALCLPPTMVSLEAPQAPVNLGELTRLRSLKVGLSAETLAQMGSLTELEELRGWWDADEDLPVLPRLTKLECGEGGIPTLPALVELNTRGDARLPERMPALRTVRMDAGGKRAALEASLAGLANYPQLRHLTLANAHWLDDGRFPEGLLALTQLESLRLLSTPWSQEARERLPTALPDCAIEID